MGPMESITAAPPQRRAPDMGRWGAYGLLVAALALSLLPLAGNTAPPERSRLFPETGYHVSGRFLDVWETFGTYEDSLTVYGLPISDVHSEVSATDGKVYQVQWFQRARYEAHPERPAPDDVELSLLGVRAAGARLGQGPFADVPRPATPTPGVDWVPETRHTLRGPFRTFWQQYGSWKQRGFPISEEFVEQPPGAPAPVRVQYFQRVRMELHPGESPATGGVILGLLGVELDRPATLTPLLTP